MPLTMEEVWTGANVIGLAVGKLVVSGKRLIAYRDGEGLFYTDDLVTLASWTASTGVPVKTFREPIKINWPNRGNPPTVAISIPGLATDGAGVYLSRNRGQDFTYVWSTNIDRWSGFVAGVSGTPVYGVNALGELRRFTWNGSAWVAETITNITRAGALIVDDEDRLLIFQKATATTRPRVLRVDDMTQTGTTLAFRVLTSTTDLGADASGEQLLRVNAMASENDYVYTVPFGQSLVVGELVDVGGGGGEETRSIATSDAAAADERAIRTVSGSDDRVVFATDAALAFEQSSVLRPPPPDPDPTPGNEDWFHYEDVMPTFRVQVQFDSANSAERATRNLNLPEGAGGSIAGDLTFGSEMPGGWAGASFKIPRQEFDTPDGQKAYRYGAVVTIRIAPHGSGSIPGSTGQTSQPNANAIVYQGMLKSPVVNPDGTVTCEAAGWKLLAEERDEDLLFVDEAYASWQPTDGDPFGARFEQGGTIQADVGKGSLKFHIDKGEEVKIGHVNRLAWWYDGHSPTRISFTIEQERGMANFRLLLEKFPGPREFEQGVLIHDAFNMGSTNVRSYDFDITTTQRPIVTLGLESLVDRGENNTAPRQQVRVKNMRIYELAFGYEMNALQCLRVLNDPSKVASPIDMFIGTAYPEQSNALVSNVTKTGRPLPRFMPLWWQDGSWWDFMVHLGTAHAFKVALWEADQGDLGSPKLEFRPWNQGPIWSVWGFHPQLAHAIVDLRPSDDVYSQVDVSFSIRGSQRLRHVKRAVTPDPFVGLPKNRKRVFRYHLEDPQPDNDLAVKIAEILAEDLSEEQYSGTITTSFVYSEDAHQKANVSLVRAGDRIIVGDWPHGNRHFRVYSTEITETQGVIQIGRTPIRVEQLVTQAHRRRMATGRISSNPAG